MNQKVTSFPFADLSFLFGIARTLDLGGCFDVYNVSRTPDEADAGALVYDWSVVQQDLESAWVRLASEHPEFITELAEAISKDQYLLKMAKRAIESSTEEMNELEEARQRV